MAIILYLGFLIGLISNFEKKRFMHKFVKNVF